MGRAIDYEAAQIILVETFVATQIDFQNLKPVKVPATIADATTLLMASNTQAFREALIGCALARILDREIDLRLPYMNQGDNAFNGRTLDEKVAMSRRMLKREGRRCPP